MKQAEIETTTQLVPRFDDRGLVTAVATHAESGALLMVAHMNAESLDLTLKSGEAWFWSRSRKALWKKGETSGHVLKVVELRVDCDQDALWLRVLPHGPVCHTGAPGCFYRRIVADETGVRLVADEICACQQH